MFSTPMFPTNANTNHIPNILMFSWTKKFPIRIPPILTARAFPEPPLIVPTIRGNLRIFPGKVFFTSPEYKQLEIPDNINSGGIFIPESCISNIRVFFILIGCYYSAL